MEKIVRDKPATVISIFREVVTNGPDPARTFWDDPFCGWLFCYTEGDRCGSPPMDLADKVWKKYHKESRK